jgi:hypothetical protein
VEESGEGEWRKRVEEKEEKEKEGRRWQVAGGRWQVAGGRWQMAGGKWQVRMKVIERIINIFREEHTSKHGPVQRHLHHAD